MYVLTKIVEISGVVNFGKKSRGAGPGRAGQLGQGLPFDILTVSTSPSVFQPNCSNLAVFSPFSPNCSLPPFSPQRLPKKSFPTSNSFLINPFPTRIPWRIPPLLHSKMIGKEGENRENREICRRKGTRRERERERQRQRQREREREREMQ